MTGGLIMALAAGLAAAPPAVARGERVTMSARVGVVVASVSAEALQDGKVGETIRVRNLQNGRVQQARVSRPGHVDIQVEVSR